MEYVFFIIGFLVFIAIGVWGFIIPSIKCAKQILRNDTESDVLPIQAIEYFALICMPIIGYILLYSIKEEIELIDWKYILVILVLIAISIFFYFLSRTKKHTTGPLILALIPSGLMSGILLAIVQLIHFSPIIFIGGIMMGTSLLFFSFLLLPVFSLLQVTILMSAELYSVLQRNKRKVLTSTEKNDLVNGLVSIYFGKHYLVAQIISFPIFITIVQYILIIFTEKPDSLIQAFIESSDGLFSQGKKDYSSTPTPEYLCTIAAYGSSNLVKSLHWGHRHGSIIRVTRQLKICNAFEEMLAEKMPKTQKILRKFYDSLQIPIDKWKKVKRISNILYILIKPMEWTFLFTLYLFEKNPETKIARQYLPKNWRQIHKSAKVDIS